MKKTVIYPLATLLLLSGGLMFASCSKAVATDTTVSTAQVQKGPLRIVIASTGKVVSNRDVDIKCRASGAVNFLPFDISDPVKENDILLKLDTKDVDQAVERAKATVINSQAKVEQAKQNLLIAKANLITDRYRAEANLLSAQARQKDAHTKFNRVRDLLAKKLASQEEFDTAETTATQSDADLKTAEAGLEAIKAQELSILVKEKDIKVAEASAASDQINLDIQNQQLKYCTIYAPIDGVVSARTVQIGTLIQSGTSNVSGGTAVMTISDLSRMFVYATVDESDIGRIQVGQKVNVTADSFPGVPFEGSVVRIAAKGVNTSNVVTFEVRIEITGRNKSLLKPEMTANVEIVNTEKEGVLLVPTQAVIRKRPERPTSPKASTTEAASTSAPATQAEESDPRRRDRNRPSAIPNSNRPTPATVNVKKDDGTTQTVEIMVGQDDGNNFEVLSGLTEGQTVVLNKSGADSKFRQGGGGGGGGGGPGRRMPF